jgi:hypothetical protein
MCTPFNLRVPPLVRRALVALAVALFAAPARATPWPSAGEARREEAFREGDVDVDDLVARARGVAASAAPRLPESWLGVVGFVSHAHGAENVGAIVVVGLALERIVATRVPSVRPVYAQGPPPRMELPVRPLLAPGLARSAVQAAWRAMGVAPDDARIDGMIARARWSALLPETRLRAIRLLDERASSDVASEQQRLYDSSSLGMSLEARLTWRLDRLLFADEEPSIERIRMDRHDARMRLAGKVLEALFQWQRAWLDADASPRGSREELDAVVKAVESEAALDVLTAGWFTAWRASRALGAAR